MLRNPARNPPCFEASLLNEVLSLNAQELGHTNVFDALASDFLNEVLSLNAQEYVADVAEVFRGSSSMKS